MCPILAAFPEPQHQKEVRDRFCVVVDTAFDDEVHLIGECRGGRIVSQDSFSLRVQWSAQQPLREKKIKTDDAFNAETLGFVVNCVPVKLRGLGEFGDVAQPRKLNPNMLGCVYAKHEQE